MIKLLIAGIAFTTVATGSASAADLPYKAPPPVTASPQVTPASTWNGFYLGIDGGVRATQNDAAVTSATVETPPQNIFTQSGSGGYCAAFNGCPNGATLDQIAGRVGFYGGWNWQANSYTVLGIEADVGWADKTNTLTGSPYPAQLHFSVAPYFPYPFGGSPTDSFAVRTTWDSSLRVRGGILAGPSILIYATGGPAWLQVQGTSTCSTVPAPGIASNCGPGNYFGGTLGPAVISDSTTRLGWTIGGGVEARLWSSNWVARAEYRFADFGTANFTDIRNCPSGCPLPPNPNPNPLAISYSLRLTTNTAMFGVAYLFGGPAFTR